MDLSDFDCMIRELLNIDAIDPSDSALNGLQVERSKSDIEKVAFAVDASMESFKRAKDFGSDLLFVHHGIFWGKPYKITGRLFKLVEFLLRNDMALYAVHLPLDMNEKYGNNIAIATKLGLKDITPFGEYHGLKIGFKGKLAEPLALADVEMRILEHGEKSLARLPFGKEKVETVGVVSGGAPEVVSEAIKEGLDLFVTGDASHTVYHEALEAGINVIFAGHYATETWGVRSVKGYVEQATDIETTFIDIPTGL